MSELVRLDSVEFGYDQPLLRVNTFSMRVGEKLFLFGPSGSGKTTLLELISGVLKPQKGKISILGTELTELSTSEKDQFRADHLGPIFQTFNLIPYLSVIENILLPLQWSGVKRGRCLGDPQDEAKNYLKELGILGIENKKVARLSVGQQQRVAVARALMGRPELIVADEPTSALDHDHREKFLNLLFSLAKKNNTAILFVSHDRSIEHFFDRSLSVMEFSP